MGDHNDPLSSDLLNNTTKRRVCDADVLKCQLCPFMSFSANDMKYHQLSTHMRLDGDKEEKKKKKTSVWVLSCPGCGDRSFTEPSLKIHLFIHHGMALKDVGRLAALVKKDRNFSESRSDAEAIRSADGVSPPVEESVVGERGDSEAERQRQRVEVKAIGNAENLPPKSVRAKSTSKSISTPTAATKRPKTSNKSGEKNLFFKCPVPDCGVRSKLKENIDYHGRCHVNDTKELQCADCKQPAASVEILHNHLWRSHKIDLDLHGCAKCAYKTYSLARLKNVHEKIHSAEKNYVCEMCTKAFKNGHQLAKHCARHRKSDDGRPSQKFACEICMRELNTRSLLSVHMKNVHEKARTFQCDQCAYSAATKSSLRLHTRSHTGEKPYRCEECNFRFTDRCSLQRHTMRHLHKKNYKCEYCSYGCIQASSIKSHIRIKHPGKKTDLLNSCPHCPYTSVNKTNYSIHLRGHKTETSVDATATNPSLNLEIENSDKEDSRLVINLEPDSSAANLETVEPNNNDKNDVQYGDSAFEPSLNIQQENRAVSNRESANIDLSKSSPTIYLNNFVASKQNLIRPRKAPKISVKSNLILKGPNSLLPFDSPFTDFRYDGEGSRPRDLFLSGHKTLLSNNIPILNNPNGSDAAPDGLGFESNINGENLNDNTFSFDSSSLENKETNIISPFCLLNEQLEENLSNFNSDLFLPSMLTDVKNKINLNAANYSGDNYGLGRDNFKMPMNDSLKFENKIDSTDDNLNTLESFNDPNMYFPNSVPPVMEDYSSSFCNLNETDSSKYINDPMVDDGLLMNVMNPNTINNTIIIDETSCDMKSSYGFDIDYHI